MSDQFKTWEHQPNTQNIFVPSKFTSCSFSRQGITLGELGSAHLAYEKFTTCSFSRHGITLGELGSAHLAYEKFTSCSFSRHGITLGERGSAHLAYENAPRIIKTPGFTAQYPFKFRGLINLPDSRRNFPFRFRLRSAD